MPTRSREIRLVARPRGTPRLEDFELAEVELPEPADGEVLVRNAFVSVDPYMRGRMNESRSYVRSFALGEPLTGGAVVTCAGPWRTSGRWWALDRSGWDRDEWDVELTDGSVYRLARDRSSGGWVIEGTVD